MALTQIGKYKVLGRIGQGAMGEVFRALDTLLHREVAVKTMSAAIGGDDDLRKRFMREAQSAARLNHPNIVTVYDFGEEEGQAYMAMELLQGRDLKELIRGGRIETLDDALPLMEQICEGVAFAHAQQMVHRDLKPGNIHVLPNGQVKIMDFGLARMGASDMTKTGMMLGTPNYMSPEQVRGEHVDIRSDVFSLGAVFYEMLAGHKAFEAESVHAVLFAVASKEPEPLSVANPDLPPVVARVVERALHKDPQERYQHAGQMAVVMGAVRDFLNGYIDEAAALQKIEDIRATSLESLSTRGFGSHDSATLVGEPTGSSGSPRSGRHPIPRPTWAGPGRIGSGGSGPRSSPPGSGPSASRARKQWLWLGGLALVGIAAAGGYGVRQWRAGAGLPQAAPQPPAAAGTGSEVLLEGARKDLQYGNYKGALEAANKVQANDPGNTEAARIATAAAGKLEEIDEVSGSLEQAQAKSQRDKGKAALEKLMTLDPGHPSVAAAARWLNEAFAPEAKRAQEKMRHAAEVAQQSKSRDSGEYERAMALSNEAERLIAKGQYAEATQKWTEAGNRIAQAAAPRVVAIPPVPRPRLEGLPTGLPAGVPTTFAPSSPAPSAVVPLATPTPTPAPQARAVPAPAPPAAAAAPASPQNDEADIRRVIHGLAAAIEAGNMTLYRQLRPSLSAADERRLRDSFARVRQKIGVDIQSIEVDGNRASARVGWNVTVPGARPASQVQNFRLARGAGGWYIDQVN